MKNIFSFKHLFVIILFLNLASVNIASANTDNKDFQEPNHRNDGNYLDVRTQDAKKHMSFIINYFMEYKLLSSTTAQKLWKAINSKMKFYATLKMYLEKKSLSEKTSHILLKSWDGSFGIIKNGLPISHDPISWSEEYLSVGHDPFKLRQIRAIVYEQTKAACLTGYIVDSELYKVSLEMIQKMQQNTVIYDLIPSIISSGQYSNTETIIVDADTIDAAYNLSLQGYKVAVLSLANQEKVGGGVIRGAQFQEESLFRRSSYFLALDPSYNKYLNEQLIGRYSIPEFGGIYTPSVLIIRGNEKAGYPFIAPFEVDFIASASYDLSKGFLFSNEKEYFDKTKEKMRAILRIGAQTGHDAMVLGTFGYGWGGFKNNTSVNARLFSEILAEDEFQGRFRLICFATHS